VHNLVHKLWPLARNRSRASDNFCPARDGEFFFGKIVARKKILPAQNFSCFLIAFGYSQSNKSFR